MSARVKHSVSFKKNNKRSVKSRRKKRKTIARKDKKKLTKRRIIIFLAIFIFIVLAICFFVCSRKFWDGKDRLSLVIRKNDGIRISTFDPELEEIINIDIPGNTEIEVARNLGILKLENVWKLSVNEGMEGKLVAETITKSFKFPIYVWAEEEAMGFSDKNYSLLKSAFYPYKTNLKMGDKIGLLAFVLNIDNVDRVNIDLAKTAYLRKESLVDGTQGYVISRNPSNRLLSIFADKVISEKEYKIIIKDVTGRSHVAQELGEILEIMGGKVVSITKGEEEDVGCVISGKDKGVTRKITWLFSCEVEKFLESGADLEVVIGKKFVDNF